MKKSKLLTKSSFLLMICGLMHSSFITKAQVSNYVFSQTTLPYTPIVGGTSIKPASCTQAADSLIAKVAIGFTFNYNGNTYDTLGVSSQGYIWFGNGTPLNTNTTPISSNTNLGGTGTVDGTVAALSRRLFARSTSPCGEIICQTNGAIGSRQFIIEYKNYRSSSGTGAASIFNFQIILNETINSIEIAYGKFTATGMNPTTVQVGLRGATNTDFNNRAVTTSWASSTLGAVNNATAALSQTVMPDSGRIYIWTPVAVCSGTPTAGISLATPSSFCGTGNIALSLSGVTAATGLKYQWQSSSDSITWTNILNDTNSIANVTPTSTTWYRCIVLCGSNGDTSTSSKATKNTLLQCYCNTNLYTAACSNNTIDSVWIPTTTLANYTNTCNSLNSLSFSQFADTGNYTATLTQGNTYSLKVSANVSARFSVWIDYDQSGTYDASEYTQITTASVANVASSVQITIPITALIGKTGMRIRSRSTAGTMVATDACTTFGSGEGEEYIITINAAPVCTSPPTAGIATATSTLLCAGQTSQLSLTGNSTGTNQTYQWQQSADSSSWTNITGASVTTYLATVNAITWFRCKVKCVDSAYSVPVKIILNSAHNCYCSTNLHTTACNNNHIDSVWISGTTLANYGNTCNGLTSMGYTHFIDTGSYTATLFKGATYVLNVSTNAAARFSAWIDYDQSGTYDATEYIPITTTAMLSSVQITIPTTALTGKTGIRIRSRSTAGTMVATDACTTFGTGETEEYVIDIATASPCTNPPAAGTVISSLDTVCSSQNFTLDLTGYSGGAGQTYQWQSSTDNATWSNISGALLTSYSTSQASANYYRCAVTCGSTVFSSSILILQKSINQCYCIPASTNTTCTNGGYIDSVAIEGTTLNNTSACSAASGTAYTLYPATANTTTSLYAGSNYEIDVRTTGANKISVWIDYNQNGAFENNEWTQVSAGTVANAVSKASINIPLIAIAGQTGMRVRSRNTGGQNDSTSACTSFASGEAEDYTITILPALANDLGISSITPVVKTCYTDTEHVVVTIRNGGINTINFATNHATVNVNIAGPNATTFTTTLTSGTLISGATKTVTLSNAYNMLNAGSYVFDANVSFSIDQNALNNNSQLILTGTNPFVTISNDTTMCGSNSVLLAANAVTTVGGTFITNYNWSTSATSNSVTVTPIATTIYTVRVRDNRGCINIDSATVTIINPPVANAGNDITICSGSSTILNASGGTDYTWDNGSIGNTQTVSPLLSTQYTVQVSTGICTSTDTVNVVVNNLPTLDITNTITTNTSCASATGSIIGSIASGTGTLIYNWTNANNVIINNNSADLNNLSAGIYYLSITDSNSCNSNSESFTILNIGAPIAPIAQAMQTTICFGGSDSLIANTSQGGTITWYLDAGLTQIISVGDTLVVSPVVNTNYYVTETSSNCESPSTTITVAINNPIAYAGADISICTGLSTTLTATGGATYTWSNGTSGNTQIVSPLNTTTYFVTATIGNCSSVDSVIVGINNPPIIDTTSITLTNTGCISASGSISGIVATGINPLIYNWTNSNNIAIGSAIDIGGLAADTYTLQITDGNGCTASINIGIQMYASPSSPVVSNATSICTGDTASLVATASSGGTINWYANVTLTQLVASGTTFNPHPANTTTYYITETANGCESIASSTIVAVLNVNANAGNSTSVCAGASTTLTVTGGVSYSWSDGNVNASQVVTPANTTTYYVTAFNGQCSSIDSVQVVVNSLPSIDETNAIQTDAICGTQNGSVVGIVASGTALNYYWTNATNTTVGTSVDLSSIGAGTYSLTVIDVNNCSSQSSDYSVLNSGAPNAPSAGTSQTICNGANVQLDATPLQAGVIKWYTDALLTQLNNIGNSYIVSPVTTTSYYVTESVSGCESQYTQVTITVNQLPTASFTYSSILNSIAIVDASTSVSTFSWNFGDGATDTTATPPTHTYSQNGLYYITLTVSNSCGSRTSIDSVTILNTGAKQSTVAKELIVYPNPATNNLTIKGGNLTDAEIRIVDAQGRLIKVSTAASYEQTINVTNLPNGIYQVIIVSKDDVIHCKFIKQ